MAKLTGRIHTLFITINALMIEPINSNQSNYSIKKELRNPNLQKQYNALKIYLQKSLEIHLDPKTVVPLSQIKRNRKQPKKSPNVGHNFINQA